MQRPRSLPARLACLAFVTAFGPATAGKVVAADATIQARNYEFFKPTVTIEVGDTVTWTFSGDVHSVTSGQPGSPDGSFDSELKAEGQTYERTFTAAGTFPYFCLVHPGLMTGTIVVGAASPTPMPTPAPTLAPTPPPTPAPTPPPTVAPTVPPASATASPSAAVSSAPPPSAEGTASSPNSSPTSTPSPAPSPSGGTAQAADGEGEIPLAALIGGGLAIGALAAVIAIRRRAA